MKKIENVTFTEIFQKLSNHGYNSTRDCPAIVMIASANTILVMVNESKQSLKIK